jgi:hypothetical protein
MVAHPLRHVPAARNDPETLGPGILDCGLNQSGRDAAAAVGGRNVGAVELEETGSGGSVGEHRHAAGGGDGEAVGVEIVLDRHAGTVARSRV